MRYSYLTLAGAALCLSGCDKIEDAVDQVLHPHSTLLVAKCVERNRDQFQNQADTRKACASKHATTIRTAPLDGTARLMWGGISGNLSNKSSDYVVTELTLMIDHKWSLDGQGKRIPMIVTIGGLWIAPNGLGEFFGAIPTPPPQAPDDGDWSWNILTARGLKLELR